jgi:APA family basic amino acid/polyamine antiporter
LLYSSCYEQKTGEASNESSVRYCEMKLKKELTLLEVFCVACGAMISSGIFILPGLAHSKAGPAVVISYLIAGLFAITGMLSQAELVSAMPKAGGDYFYVTRSMGPAVGTVGGLLTWFSLSLKSAFALIGMAAFTMIIANINIHIIAILLCLFFIIINIIGIKQAGKTQVILVLGLLALLLLYIVRGIPSVNVHFFDPFAPNGFAAIFTTAGFVFVSYGGLLKIASIAEEVKNPTRVIPLAMIFALLVVTILYILVIFVTSGVLGAEQLDESLTPLSDGAATFMGNWGKIALSIAAILAFVSTANAGIMAASRYPLALSRDGLLPGLFGMVNKRFKTPHVSILFTGGFMIAALFLKLEILVKAASTVLLLTFTFSCIAVIILRESRVQNYQPVFRTPLYPWIQIIGIFFFVFLIFEMGKEALLTASIMIIGSILIYLFYGRFRTKMEYALLHLVERITARELIKGRTLESELKQIIRERDDITKDRFDRVIEKSIVIDIEKEMDIEEFFRLASAKISQKINIERNKLLTLLLSREKESSTAIRKDLAIPHIIVEGEKIFCILIARCKKGIKFSEYAPEVNAVFVIIGTRDERNFHLQALASIAQIVQDPNFEKRWLQAKNKESLRDIILLGKRRR